MTLSSSLVGVRGFYTTLYKMAMLALLFKLYLLLALEDYSGNEVRIKTSLPY
jgi:hypothetical protein